MPESLNGDLEHVGRLCGPVVVDEEEVGRTLQGCALLYGELGQPRHSLLEGLGVIPCSQQWLTSMLDTSCDSSGPGCVPSLVHRKSPAVSGGFNFNVGYQL